MQLSTWFFIMNEMISWMIYDVDQIGKNPPESYRNASKIHEKSSKIGKIPSNPSKLHEKSSKIVRNPSEFFKNAWKILRNCQESIRILQKCMKNPQKSARILLNRQESTRILQKCIKIGKNRPEYFKNAWKSARIHQNPSKIYQKSFQNGWEKNLRKIVKNRVTRVGSRWKLSKNTSTKCGNENEKFRGPTDWNEIIIGRGKMAGQSAMEMYPLDGPIAEQNKISTKVTSTNCIRLNGPLPTQCTSLINKNWFQMMIVMTAVASMADYKQFCARYKKRRKMATPQQIGNLCKPRWTFLRYWQQTRNIDLNFFSRSRNEFKFNLSREMDVAIKWKIFQSIQNSIE